MIRYIPSHHELITALEDIRDNAFCSTVDDELWMDNQTTLAAYIDMLINRYVLTEEETELNV